MISLVLSTSNVLIKEKVQFSLVSLLVIRTIMMDFSSVFQPLTQVISTFTVTKHFTICLSEDRFT